MANCAKCGGKIYKDKQKVRVCKHCGRYTKEVKT